MDIFRVAGAGTSAVNGDYPESGTYDGRPYYQFGTYYMFNRAGIGYGRVWAIAGSLNPGPASELYGVISDAMTPPSSGWDANGGDDPAPTVTPVVLTSYNGAGAGSSGFDGVYVESSPSNGKPTYAFDTTTDKFAWWDGYQWKLGTAINGLDSDTYYLNDSTSPTLPLTGWYSGAFTGGVEPGPTFSLVLPPTGGAKTGMIMCI